MENEGRNGRREQSIGTTQIFPNVFFFGTRENQKCKFSNILHKVLKNQVVKYPDIQPMLALKYSEALI